eukprot:SAG31_NODE_388_length_16371_cov_5.228982_7_plen_107_part_00
MSEEFNDKGGTELAPMSTTLDVAVAVGYATESGCSGSALMFRIVTENNLQRGAGLSVCDNRAYYVFDPRFPINALPQNKFLLRLNFICCYSGYPCSQAKQKYYTLH